MNKIILKLQPFILIILFLSFMGCVSSKNSHKVSKVKKSKKEPLTFVIRETVKKPVRKDWVKVYSGDDNILKWKLKSIKNQKASDLYTNLPVLRFDESWKQVYGSAECNRYTGYYQLNDSIFGINRFTSTDKPCKNEHESMLFNILQEVNGLKESPDQLTLSKDDTEVLIFEKY